MDPVVNRLRHFFRQHPVWVEAARTVRDGANSQVFFSHLSGEWHLIRRQGVSYLNEGPAPDPDFAFRFTPSSVDAITSTDGDVGDFAVELVRCITSADPDYKVEFRVLAPFARLLKRGYVQVLLRGGPRMFSFAASQGIRTLADLRRLFAQLQGLPLDSDEGGDA